MSSPDSSSVKRIEKCRVCGNPDLLPCIDIGSQYLSSVFPENLNYRDRVPEWPLGLVMCSKKDDRTCGLVQLAYRLDLTSMYDAYPYTSATNSSMTAILEDVAQSGLALKNLSPDDVVLDIGGNDGTLLSFFRDESVSLLNIDPAKNVKSLLDSPRYAYVPEFFSEKSFHSASPKNAKLIFSIAMFYHLDDPMRFVREVSSCLDEEGVWIIQMAYLPAMLRTNMYDNIVHEHVGYYAATHMKWIMDQVGLEVFDVLENNVYGGSFRIFVKKKNCQRFSISERYLDLLNRESAEGIFNPATYENFMKRIEKTRDDLRNLCDSIRKEGKTIWIYGASTKGNTILQYCDLGAETFVAAADANPFKIGKYIIASDTPIKSEAEMRAARPDYLLALPYSFVDAFVKRESDLVSQGTKFIVPLPEVRVLSD